MKIIHGINAWSFGITLFLYLLMITGLLALVAQILLGGIQVLLAIIILFYWGRLNPQNKILITSYWLITISYGLISYFFIEELDHIWPFFFIILPMSIAGYFVIVTYKIKTQLTKIRQT